MSFVHESHRIFKDYCINEKWRWHKKTVGKKLESHKKTTNMDFTTRFHHYFRVDWDISDITQLSQKYLQIHPKTSNAQKLVAVVLVACASAIIRRIYLTIWQRRNQLPPFLHGVPYFGSLFAIGYYKRDFGLKLLPKYGPICSYNLGNQTVICLNDYSLVEKLFCHPNAVIQRPDKLRLPNREPTLVSCNPQHNWCSRRNLILNAINSMSNCNFMDNQAKYLCEKIVFPNIDEYCFNKQEWYCRNDIHNCAFNMIFGSLFGEKCHIHKNDTEYNEFIQLNNSYVSTFGISFLARILWLPFGIENILFGNVRRKHETTHSNIHEYIKKYVNNSIEQLNTKSESNLTFFDEMYKEILENKNEKYSYYIDDKNLLVGDIFSILGASIDTTALALETMILYLAKYPKLQEIINNELITAMYSSGSKVVNGNYKSNENGIHINNTGAFIKMNEILKCVKFRAFVHETLRITSPAARGLPRVVSVPFELSFDS